MPAPYASSVFTPELSAQVLASDLNTEEEGERTAVGNARKEGAAGGLVAQAATGSRIGAIESGATSAENADVANFNLDVANKSYSERMTDEGQAFQDTERQKTEAFQQSMAQMGYAFQDSQRVNEERNSKITGEQGLVEGAGAEFGSKYLSTLLTASGGAPGGGGNMPGYNG